MVLSVDLLYAKADHGRVDLRKRLGANVLRARKERGWSQEELGNRCGLHRTEVSLLERGLRMPRLETLVKLAGALGVDTNRLCEGISWLAEEDRLEVVEAPLLPPRVKRPPGRPPSR